MNNNPNINVLMQKAENIQKAKNTKVAKFSSNDLSLSLSQFRRQFPNANADIESQWLEQRSAANPINQNRSFLEDAATDVGIAFGDRLPQTVAALVGLGADAIGADSVADWAWGEVAEQQQDTAESQALYSPSLKESKAKLIQVAQARKEQYMADGQMTVGESVSEFANTVLDYAMSPRAAASEAIQSSESLVTAVAGGGIIGGVAKGVAKKAVKKRIGEEGLKRAAAKKVIDKAGTDAATRSGLLYTGVSEGASTAVQTRDALNEIPDDVLKESADFKEYLNQNGGDFDKAKDEFVKSGTADAFLQTAVVAAAIGKVSGASDNAATALVSGSTKTAKREVAEAVGKETVEEAAQSGSSEVISNIQVKEGDESKDVLEDVGTSAGAGAVTGGLTGGAVTGSAKVAKKAVDAGTKGIVKAGAKADEFIEKQKKVTAKEEDTAITKGYETAKPDSLDKFTSLKGKDLIKATPEIQGTMLALRERQDISPEEKTAINEKIATIRSNLESATVEATKQQEAAVQKAESEPENLTEQETQLAVSGVVAEDGSVNTGLAKRLAGSKHTTSNQKALMKALSNPESVVSKSLKTTDEVHRDILEGGENFTGLREYVDTIQLAMKTGSQDMALKAMFQLQRFNKAQKRKAQTGILNGKPMSENLHELVQEESEAIDIVFKAIDDTVTKTFPEVAEIKAESAKKFAEEQASRLVPARKGAHTVPQTQREELVRESVASVLNPKVHARETQLKLRKAGFTLPKIKKVEDALETVAAAENIPVEERTPETTQELREAQELLSDTYVTLKDALGEEGLVEALKTHGDVENVDRILESLPQDRELNTAKLDLVQGHVPVSRRRTEISDATGFNEFSNMQATLKDYVEKDLSVLEKEDGLKAAYNEIQKTELNAFSENTQAIYNLAADLINTLEVPNAEITSADSSTKAVSTTPRNRTFQNMVEGSPVGSVLRSFRSFIPTKRTGLIHTESNMVQKLSDTDSDIYLHLTRNLSHADKQDLNKFIRFANKYEKKLNKTLKGRSHTFKKEDGSVEQSTSNDYLDDFLLNDAFTPEAAVAIATGYANWSATNGSKSLYNNAAGIARLLGETNVDDFRPTTEERKLEDAGIATSFVAEQIGRDIIKVMGLNQRGDTNEVYTKQMAVNLGLAAISAGLMDGNNSSMVRQYAHILRDGKGKVVSVWIDDKATKTKGEQVISTVKARPNKVQEEGEPTRLNSLMEDANAGALNSALMRDFFGVEPTFRKAYMQGEAMPEHKVEDGLSQVQVDALNKNQEIEYELDASLWDLMNQFDPEFKMGLVDGLPSEGTEHKNNTKRNQSIREGILQEFKDVETMISDMEKSGSKTLRFANSPSKKNKRISQVGTLGNPQNSNLVRHLFKMKNAVLSVDPKDADMLLSYKMAVLEALDEKGSIATDDVSARGVDKSEDSEINAAFDAYMAQPEVKEAIAAINRKTRTRKDVETIQEFVGYSDVKRGKGTSGTAARLDGLINLAQYRKSRPFEVNLFKENDGITNGIAIGLLQLASADTFQQYVDKLAKVGIYVDSEVLAFGTFAKSGQKDSYESFGSEMTNSMKEPEKYPDSKDNILPELNLNRNISNIFMDKEFREDSRNNYIPITDAKGKTTKQPRLVKNKFRITREEYGEMSGAMSFFLGKKFHGDDGKYFKDVTTMVQEVIRDFAKSPLMIANYGASMIGLKKAVANAIASSIELALEDIAKETDPEVRAANIQILETNVNNMSVIKDEVVTEWGEEKGKAVPLKKEPWVFKVADNPLETDVGTQVYNAAAIGVELSYGAAMERAFEVEYGSQRKTMDKVIQATRIATAVYSKLLDKAKVKALSESDKDYLTVDEVNQIKEDLRPYSPMIATAMSDDRFNDGIWIPKGEKSKDRNEQGDYLNPETDKVKVSLKFGSNASAESHTSSDKIQDPSVSAAAVMVQSLDATTQVLSMLESTLVNVHDASIFSLADSFEGTLKQNQGFIETMEKYSILDAVIEMYDGVMSHPDVTGDLLAEAYPDFNKGVTPHVEEYFARNEQDFGENADIEDTDTYFPVFRANLKETSETIAHNKKLLLEHSDINTNQYSAGDKSAYVTKAKEERTTEDKEVSWKNIGDDSILVDGKRLRLDPETGTYREVSVLESSLVPEVAEKLDNQVNTLLGEETETTPVQQTPEYTRIDEDTIVEDYGTTRTGKRDKRVSDEVLAVKDTLLARLNEGQYYAAAKKEMLAQSKDKATKSLFKSLDRKMKLAARGSTNSARSERANDAIQELAINRETAGIIFDSLDGIGSVKPSDKDKAALRGVLEIIEPHLANLNLKIFAENGTETQGAVTSSGIELVINTGTKASGIEMSPQEVLVHELMHTFLQGIDKNSRAYREIKKMYQAARKDLRPEDFLGDIENPTAKDWTDAKARYNHAVHNSYEGGQKYKTYLGEEKVWMNADPVEEFAVMAMTNPLLRQALEKKELRHNEEAGTFFGKIKAMFAWLLDQFSKDLTLTGTKADARIIRLAEHLHGSLNQKKALMYRVTSIVDTPLDAASDWVKGIVNNYASQADAAYTSLKHLEATQTAEDKLKSYRDAAYNTAFAKNSLVQGIYNEFTTGRRSLSALARLISKSSHVIERKSQFFVETITKDLNNLMEDITDDQRVDVYRLLETDAQSLLGQYSAQEVMDFMTDNHKRKVRISQLVKNLQRVAPSASRYMNTHAKDLGYHMVTGERLILDGKYTNSLQIANMWGFKGNTGRIQTAKAQAIVDELATLNALEYAQLDTSMASIFGSKLSELETILNYQKQTVEVALDTTFKGNEFNFRKGYVKEEYENRVDIIVADRTRKNDLEARGYQMGEAVIGDPLTRGLQQYYFTKENGEMTKYLTGALSTAAPKSRGTDLFQVSGSDSELHKLRVQSNETYLRKGKEAESARVFAGSNSLLKAEHRGHVAQPIFNSNGDVTGYRYIASHFTKDKVHGRKKDFARAIGVTFASVSRRIETKGINEELVDYFHQTFTDSYHKNPDLFVNVADDPKYRDQYNLMPREAKQYANQLFGKGKLYVPRTQVDIAFGYRKFSVAQLQYDKHPQATALRNVLRHTNNLAAIMFNNRAGMTVEAYWQAFVATAKDTLVIKSGIVTAANIASNLTLLWISGVSPAQASKDHAEAYTATWKYLKDQEKQLAIQLKLDRPHLSNKERVELKGELAYLNQELFNNPVRELMEAGMYSAIVDDVEVGEHVVESKDWIDKKLEPIANKTPEAVKAVAKTFMLTHDTKAYKVMRDIAQISDFAARYSLHKHNLSNGMKREDSIEDIRTTFVDYDTPSHKALQYANDMGLMGFTKYFFRIQQVILKKFADRPARVIGFALLNNMLGLGIASPLDASFGVEAMSHRFYGVDDWVDFSTQTAPMNLLVH